MRFLLAAALLAGTASALNAQDAARAARLVRAYPGWLAGIQGDDLLWRDGHRTPFRSARTPLSYSDLLDHADLHDQMAAPYPGCAPIQPPAHNQDPGRARDEAFFKTMYGATSDAVRRQLVPVDWFGQRLLVSRVNGVDRALAAVAKEIAARPELRRYVSPSAGTFLWRPIAGTQRLSAHAYGIAIDLNTAYSDYWRWGGYEEGQTGIPYRNRMPLALVSIFERHGFVWGGRWYHEDTMHFEYRPELAGCAPGP